MLKTILSNGRTYRLNHISALSKLNMYDIKNARNTMNTIEHRCTRLSNKQQTYLDYKAQYTCSVINSIVDHNGRVANYMYSNTIFPHLPNNVIVFSKSSKNVILSHGMVIGIDTDIEVIVVALTTWEAHHSPRAKPKGCGELPRSLMRQKWPKLRYQFLFYHDETKLMINKQTLAI